MANVPTRICELVETFDQHIEAYRSSQYNETQLRREFIDPFFEELGWDVTNKAGYAQAYKDVIHEDAIKIGSATKAPDYCFRIGGSRKFFLEAKKPSVDIKGDPHPAYQLRRYAWSAKLPLSILTDFEEFAVYDCQMRPKHTDRADVSRIMLFTYKDYLKKFPDIADIFSKEAILKGSFDKFAAATKGKRGTSTVDKEFLAEIEKWRNMLARIIALRNASLSVREINFCVQRTIDRILFLRMCEDRGIEPYGQLQSVSSGERTYPRLCEVFEKADQKYNSGLFYFHDEPDRAEGPDELTPNIIIDDKDLKWILHSLYYPQSPYEFSVLPAEILGNVYEQFLGKVITLSSAHRANVEDKPEVKKAGGVYYTPSYIVDYIVKNTVGKLCEGKTPRQIDKLKILDPACGSGSFLIGAYQYLLDWHLKYYTENEPEKHMKGKNPKIFETTTHLSEYVEESQAPHYGLTITEKKRILLNNIFGVDIDSQAVEVTKLSLLLKVLEGESSETIDNQYRLFHERALPDLANNIKCGNSLIGLDFYDNLEPEEITEELQQKINAFDWQAEFPEIFSGKNPGFDTVIGNPPYVRSITLKESDHVLWSACHSRFRSAESREWDIYLVFVERGLSLLNTKGTLGFILPNKFINSRVGTNLRIILSEGQHLNRLVHFGALQIFPNATTYTCLLFLTKYQTKEAIIYRYVGSLGTSISDKILPEQAPELWSLSTVQSDALGAREWQFMSRGTAIFTHLKGHIKLGSIATIFQGTGTRADKVFVLNILRKEAPFVRVYSGEKNQEYVLECNYLKSVLRGRSISRYTLQGDDLCLLVPYTQDEGKFILVPESKLSSEVPKTVDYLRQCKVRLNAREKGRFKGQRWYCYGRPQNMEKFDVPEKLIMPDVVKRGECFLDAEQKWILDTAYGLVLKKGCVLNLRFILGILNSHMLSFFLKETGTALRGGYFRMKTAYIEPFPIPNINLSSPNDKDKHDQMVKLVDRILNLHKKLSLAKIPEEKTRIQRQIDATDKQIDKLVYDLYGLTEEEIKIVESSIK